MPRDRSGEFTANLSRAKRAVGPHTTNDEQNEDMDTVRDVGAQLIATMMTLCPASADRSAAIRKVREAVMTANAAIASNGQDHTRTP